MTKFGLLLFAAALAVFGVSITIGYPPWGAVTGISVLLTAGAMAAGALARDARAGNPAETKAARQRVPHHLVALSATAIAVVYAAGYYRTQSAADQFVMQANRHSHPAPPVAAMTIPTPVLPPVAVPPAAPPSTDPPHTSDVKPQIATKPIVPPPPAPVQETPAIAVPLPLPVVSPKEPEPVAPVVTKQTSYKDGTFLGWGRCRHGRIEASVSIEGGQIVATEITQCLTRYSCSWISELPGQVVTRQSADVDYVSGATESTDAFYDAISSALAAARE